MSRNMKKVKDSKHKENVIEFVGKLKTKFQKVTANKNNLPIVKDVNKPTQKESIYRPDILVKDINGNITHILEIETGDGGKSMVGAIFLADACISKHIEAGIQNSRIKSDLIFVILGKKYNAIKRIEAIKPHLKKITHINYHIYTKREAYETLFKN